MLQTQCTQDANMRQYPKDRIFVFLCWTLQPVPIIQIVDLDCSMRPRQINVAEQSTVSR